jgi:hypothetical protein
MYMSELRGGTIVSERAGNKMRERGRPKKKNLIHNKSERAKVIIRYKPFPKEAKRREGEEDLDTNEWDTPKGKRTRAI